MDLTEELKDVEEALAQAGVEQARLRARIAGLEAQRDALRLAIGPDAVADNVTPIKQDLSGMPKARAIKTVLKAASTPMTIRQIVQALEEAGRPLETYNGISVYLQDLLGRGDVVRVSRGLYTAA